MENWSNGRNSMTEGIAFPLLDHSDTPSPSDRGLVD
jgi:hypothetical protein